MRTVFHGKKITGILGVLPQNEYLFDEETKNYTFPEKQTMRLKKVMGYEKHRLVKPTTASSDLCIFGLNHLLRGPHLKQEDIGAIVVVTTTPDHIIPTVSTIIQGGCCLGKDTVCIDINQGCVGFLVGLMESFLLLSHLEGKKVVLFTVDTLSKRVSPKDRNSYPLIGDAAGITIIENDPLAGDIHFILYNDGTRKDALIVPAGGSRIPSSPETSILRDYDNDGNLRSLDNLKMNGSEVFVFAQTEVPPVIEETLRYACLEKNDIDRYLLHQPNKFMLRKIAEKLGIPYERMPMNIVENYGNPSSASIPIAIAHNLRTDLLESTLKCCLSAFGSGLSWGALTIDLGRLDFCEMLISDC